MLLLLFSALAVACFLMAFWISRKVDRQIQDLTIRLERASEALAGRTKAMNIAAAPHENENEVAPAQKAAPATCPHSFSLDLLLPMAFAKDAQANLDEVMPVWVERHGERKARIIRAAQIGRIVIGHWSRPLVKMARRLVGL